MPIEPGSTLLHYRIVDKLGEGGMGVVWRATDTTLDREVAIKVLPEPFAGDAERLARFEREAKTLATLNHPHIAAVYGLHAHEGTRFIAMEYVAGEDLAERLAHGPLPVDEAIALGRQIADALEAAHERGVIHRDLKPANVKLTPDGKAKVLDFGLAKGFEPSSAAGSDPAHSPTVTSAGTLAGTIVGTAAYMSPEQAKGKPVDRRADIWAFGVMLHEMLTGNGLFAGESISETLAAVLMSEPDLDTLPANTPPRVRRLIERCLRREPGSRLRDIGDARVVLDEALAAREWTAPVALGEERAVRGTRAWPIAAAALIAGLAVGAGLASLLSGGPPPRDAPPTRLAIPLPDGLHVARPLLLTPDGRTVVFRARSTAASAPDREHRLWVRRLDDDALREVPDSKGALAHALSPDGRWLAFARFLDTRGELFKVPLDLSAPPLRLADWPDSARNSLVWLTPERIYGVRTTGNALVPFPAAGGAPAADVPLVSEFEIAEMWLTGQTPDRRHLLAHAGALRSGAYRQDVGVVDPASGEFRLLIDDGSFPVYHDGQVVFSRRGHLLAAPFDARALSVTGPARAVETGLWSQGMWTGGHFGLSASGDLIYAAGEVQGNGRFLSIVTAAGEVTPWSGFRLPLNAVRSNHDGSWVAFQVDNITEGDALLQIRVSSLETPRMLTVGAQPGMDCHDMAWSNRGDELAYTCSGQGGAGVWITTPSGGGEPLVRFGSGVFLDDVAGFVSGDTHVIVEQITGPDQIRFLSLPRSGADPQKIEDYVLPMEEDRVYSPRLSPDGRWLTYVGVESGRRQQFVRELKGPTELGRRYLVPGAGDRWAWWGKKFGGGRYELLTGDAQVIERVDFDASVVPPRFGELQRLPIDGHALGVVDSSALTGGRFLLIRRPEAELGSTSLRLVQNWRP